MSACKCDHGLHAVRFHRRDIHDQQIGAAVEQFTGEIFGLRDLHGEVTAAFEQPAKQFANGEVPLENQNGARNGGEESAGSEAAGEFPLVSSVSQFRLRRIRTVRLDRRCGRSMAGRSAPGRHQQQGRDGRSGRTAANWDATPDKSVGGKPGSGMARETSTPAKYPARCGGSKDESRATRSWAQVRPVTASLPNSGSQRTERLLRLSDTWNTRHNGTDLERRPYLMIVVTFEMKLMWLALGLSAADGMRHSQPI